MAVIKITTFGGEVPSLSARSLPADKARISYNLYPGVNEFRPLKENKTVATIGVTNPQTLFRLERKADGTLNDDPATGWLPYAGLRSFAKGQINDDLTGRTYYSFDDGSAPPRVMDAGVNPARDGLPVSAAVDKPLGIPPPKAPKVELLVGDELTPDEYADVMQIKTAEIAARVRESASFQLVGAYAVDHTVPGYLASAVVGVVAAPQVTGTSGGGFAGVQTPVVIGGGGGVELVGPRAPILLGTGGSLTLNSLFKFYTSSTGVHTNLSHGEVYTWRQTVTDVYKNYALSADGASMVFA